MYKTYLTKVAPRSNNISTSLPPTSPDEPVTKFLLFWASLKPAFDVMIYYL